MNSTEELVEVCRLRLPVWLGRSIRGPHVGDEAHCVLATGKVVFFIRLVSSILDTIPISRLRFQVLSEGREGGGSDNEKGIIVNQIRRTLSMSVMKAQVGCLSGKIQQAGPSNK